MCIRWSFVDTSHTSWDICYFISTSFYRPSTLLSHSPRHTAVFIDPSYLRSVSRHFVFLWAWLKILRHIRHHKKCASAHLPSVKKPHKKIPIRSGDIGGAAPRFTLQKSGHCSRVKRSMYRNRCWNAEYKHKGVAIKMRHRTAVNDFLRWKQPFVLLVRRGRPNGKPITQAKMVNCVGKNS